VQQEGPLACRAVRAPPPFFAMGDQPKQIVAAKYQQTTSRATPDAVARELRKLPAASGPLDSRKRALHDLAHALAYVQEQHKTKVVETCTKEDAAALLLSLLADIDAAPPVPASEDVIRVGRRVLGMGPMDARLYVLSCFVNLAYLGGAGMLRLPPSGLPSSAMEVLVDTLLNTADSESVLFYAVAGLYNLSNDGSFAELAGRKPGLLQKLEQLSASPNPDTVKYASGTVEYWRKHASSWPPPR